jgi:hypothetical protein
VIKDSDDSTEACHDTEEKAKKHMAALYASENRKERAPIEARAATVEDVDVEERIVTVLAAPYDQEAVVEYRGELWRETFERGAFDGIENRPPIPGVQVYRDHVAGENAKGSGMSGLVGRVVSFDPKASAGLIAEAKIAETALGNDTLALAKEKVLGVSIGFGVRGSDQLLDRATQSRRIRRAFVDHLAFPDRGAYEGAQVLDVRSAHVTSAELPPLVTPKLDEVVAWMEARKAPR